MSNNKYLMHFLANLLDKSINVPDVKDCTVVGAGISARLIHNIYEMKSVLNLTEKIESFKSSDD